MTSSTDLDIFDGLTPDTATSDSETPETSTANDGSVSDVEASSSTADDSDSNAEERAVETVPEVPEGAVGVPDFAAHMTQYFMKQRVLNDEEFDGSEYVVAQAVYQTVKASRDRIPHVIVKGENDKEGRVYILENEATQWWIARRERLSSRGTGISKIASQRSAEDNLALLAKAVQSNLYANDRMNMWTEKVADSEKLVEKYKGFLSEQKVNDETMALAVQEATQEYERERAEKEAERLSKLKKNAKKETSE